MLRFIVRRILEAVPTLFCIATITFFMIRLAPGGPFSSEKNISPTILRNLNEHYGLDKPLFQQYTDFLKNALRGNLGPSFTYPNRTVNELIASSFPVSLELGVLAMSMALILGIVAGIGAAWKQNSLFDHIVMSGAMVGICVPTFVMGPLLALVFALKWNLVDVSGWNSPGDRILPAVTLALPYAAYIARLCRGGMLEILPREFIRTARAKGVGTVRLLVCHALRGGIQPVVSFLGPAFAGIITGSFVIETLFQVPGLGRHFVNAAFNRDYFMIQGTVLFFALCIISLNTVVDIVQVVLDPRLQLNDRS